MYYHDCEIGVHSITHINTNSPTAHMKIVATPGHYATFISIVALLALVTGCATTKLPPAAQLRVPEPIQGNTGKYMCPYTADGTVTEWVVKAKNAKMFKDVFAAAGAYAGTQAVNAVPIIGGILGHWLGKKVGHEVAIQAAGGRNFIKSKSDLSFDNAEDEAVYMYARHSTQEEYLKVLKVTGSVYPELQKKYAKAIKKAELK